MNTSRWYYQLMLMVSSRGMFVLARVIDLAPQESD